MMANVSVYNGSDIHVFNITDSCETPSSVQLGNTYAVLALFFLILMLFQNGFAIVIFNISADDRSVSRTIHSVILSSAFLYGLVQIPVWIKQLSNGDLSLDKNFIYTCLILLPGVFHTIFMWISVLLAVHRALIMIQITNERFWGNQLRKLWRHHKRRIVLATNALRNRHTKYTILESNTIIIISVTLVIEFVDCGLRTHQIATTLYVNDLCTSLSVMRMLRLVIYGLHLYIHVITNFKLRRSIKLYYERLRSQIFRPVPMDMPL
ncbi:uncharacterized protein LOC125658997 isoform X2 [Ostrea edulis]|uniref:uncharacterized protein LOC125658997 isoform X2 n=1 Tax=Ostrea edulis TaxID=37623 RepID=UPI0024AFEDEC|nr:uncharacterized protein LOC125658997 isoform X2 [Ostrea edulis]